jgi:hypothetical protein
MREEGSQPQQTEFSDLKASVLRGEILCSLKAQGFNVNPHLRPKHDGKATLRRIHRMKRLEQLRLHKHFLQWYSSRARENGLDGKDIRPEEIRLKLFPVTPGSEFANLFFWWNLIWWSIPYEHPIGRYMRFIIWDKEHDAPFGLLGLQSPPLRSNVRDNYLGIQGRSVDYWVNQSLNATRVGALPPYNMLLGGRMVAMALTANEIRDHYALKYASSTLMRKRRIPGRLLFTTTTSAFGRGSIYERLTYKQRPLNRFIGFTSGSGTFHLPNNLYVRLLGLMEEKGIDVKRGYGTGTSRKLRLVKRGSQILGLPNFAFHNVQRGYYLFPNVTNLSAVLHQRAKPRWKRLPFDSLANYWQERWCVPRASRFNDWREFETARFFRSASAQIRRL